MFPVHPAHRAILPVLWRHPDKDATAPLRAAGFRFNKVLQHWEGLARIEEAQSLAKAHGGTARQVAAPLPVPAALETAAE